MKDKTEYLAYIKAAEKALEKRGSKQLIFGKLIASPIGDIEPRQVLMAMEWDSMASIKSYIEDPDLYEVHPHRDNGVDDFVWQLFEKLEDLVPVLKS